MKPTLKPKETPGTKQLRVEPREKNAAWKEMEELARDGKFRVTRDQENGSITYVYARDDEAITLLEEKLNLPASQVIRRKEDRKSPEWIRVDAAAFDPIIHPQKLKEVFKRTDEWIMSNNETYETIPKKHYRTDVDEPEFSKLFAADRANTKFEELDAGTEEGWRQPKTEGNYENTIVTRHEGRKY